MKKFTLIELLIVIAIIGILASILMPSLQKARLKSVRVVDLSNCRQFASYCILYADNNDSNVPVGYRGWGNDDLAWFNSSVKDEFLDVYDMPESVMGCNSYNYVRTNNGNDCKWIYWGGRKDEWTDGSTYVTADKLTDEPTTKTFVTCKQYVSYQSWNSMLAHAPEKNILNSGGSPSTLPVTPDGINVVRLDLSGVWAHNASLKTIKNYNFLYYLED